MSRVLVGCGASAALHKGVDLVSKLSQAGHEVRTVLTPRAAALVSPQLFEAVSGGPAYVDEFDEERHGAMDHIDLADWAELFVVAPATADLIARLALGLAGDLITTVSLALAPDIPRIFSPAMNPRMWAAPAVKRHTRQLFDDGWRLIEPDKGHMACGDAGTGRFVEPAMIVEAVAQSLENRS